MKKLISTVAAAVAFAALAADTDVGALITASNIEDVAAVENLTGANAGKATITINNNAGTANSVTVYNAATVDTALSGKASTGDITALQTRATALETATNNLTTAVAGCAAYSENGKLTANGYIVPWGYGGYIEFLGESIHFYHPSVHGSGEIDRTITFPTVDGTLSLLSDIPTQFDYTAITNAPWLLSSAISSWALASTKPSYNFSEIGSKPTTLSGYGITDAKISNGTITLGSATITPLTSFTETDPTALKPSQLKVNGTAMTTASAAVELGQYYVKTVDGKPHLMLRE